MLNAAAGGTLFLDEIAEMPIDLQTRFLRVLQEREFRPLGSTQSIKADFRLVAASNRRPEDAIRLGRLREDLFYRLNTFTLSIPPLRERTEDIPELAQVFLQRFCTKMNKPLLTIQSEAYDALLRYPWPGNVRQLQNVIERAVVLTQGSMITRRNLPQEVVHSAPFDPTAARPPRRQLGAFRAADADAADDGLAVAESCGTGEGRAHGRARPVQREQEESGGVAGHSPADALYQAEEVRAGGVSASLKNVI